MDFSSGKKLNGFIDIIDYIDNRCLKHSIQVSWELIYHGIVSSGNRTHA